MPFRWLTDRCLLWWTCCTRASIMSLAFPSSVKCTAEGLSTGRASEGQRGLVSSHRSVQVVSTKSKGKPILIAYLVLISSHRCQGHDCS